MKGHLFRSFPSISTELAYDDSESLLSNLADKEDEKKLHRRAYSFKQKIQTRGSFVTQLPLIGSAQIGKDQRWKGLDQRRIR
jgi:hypothetical protein